MDEAIEEQVTPLWQRFSLRHLGLLLAAGGIIAISVGLWLHTAQADPAAALDPAAQADPAAALDPAAQADPAAALDPAASLDQAAFADEAGEAALATESGTAKVDMASSGNEAAGKAPAQPQAALMTVYVVGAVMEPGVYQLAKDARVNDLVLQAGGLSDDADSLQINLAQRIEDGQQVYVPHQGEVVATPAMAAADAANLAAGGAGATDGAGEARSASGAGALLNINQAGASELEVLPRIGPALAQRIVEHRQSKGPFASVEGLREVKGISEGVFTAIAALVTVE